MILVDLDNLIITQSKLNMTLFKKRKEVIEKLGQDVIWFCNKVTANIMKEFDIKLLGKLVVTKVEADSADHHLIHFALKKKNHVIISNDKALMRLLYFMNHNGKMLFFSFKKEQLLKNSISICFEKRQELEKFLQTYNLYKIRFGHAQ